MNIVMISPNQEKFPAPVVPIGAAYIISALEENGHTVEFIDLCFEEKPIEKIVKHIKDKNFDLICISIRNIDNESMFRPVNYLDYLKNIVKAIRSSSNAKILIGGAAFSLMPKEIFDFLQIDIGFIGEGEQVINEIIDNINNSKNLISRNYIVTKQDDTNKKYSYYRANKGFNNIFPKREYYNPKYYYWDSVGIQPKESIQTRRGCCFSCSFCKTPKNEGNTLRLRDINNVIKEIKQIVDKGIDSLFFVDSLFNIPEDYAKEICIKIIENKIRIKWMCYMSPKKVSKELALLMKNAGCIATHFGTDHLSNTMLENLQKGFTFEEILATNLVCKKVGLKCVHSILFGGKGETNKTINECIENLYFLKPDVLFFSMGIRIYPSTQIYFDAIEEGVISKSDSLLRPKFYLSKGVDLKRATKDIMMYMKNNNKSRIVKCSFDINKIVNNN